MNAESALCLTQTPLCGGSLPYPGPYPNYTRKMRLRGPLATLLCSIQVGISSFDLN